MQSYLHCLFFLPDLKMDPHKLFWVRQYLSTLLSPLINSMATFLCYVINFEDIEPFFLLTVWNKAIYLSVLSILHLLLKSQYTLVIFLSEIIAVEKALSQVTAFD